jgi:hypothetical protein
MFIFTNGRAADSRRRYPMELSTLPKVRQPVGSTSATERAVLIRARPITEAADCTNAM